MGHQSSASFGLRAPSSSSPSNRTDFLLSVAEILWFMHSLVVSSELCAGLHRRQNKFGWIFKRALYEVRTLKTGALKVKQHKKSACEIHSLFPKSQADVDILP